MTNHLCNVCQQDARTHCICQPCRQCGQIGDEACYLPVGAIADSGARGNGHGATLTKAQRTARLVGLAVIAQSFRLTSGVVVR